MEKKDFLDDLKNKLSQLPESQINKQIEYYDQLIDSYMDYGLSQEEAINLLGTDDEIYRDVILNTNIFILIKSFFIREDGRKMDKSGKLITIVTAPIWAIFYLFILVFSLIVFLIVNAFMIGLVLVLLVLGYSGIKIILSGITMIFTNIISFTTYLGFGLMLIGLTLILYDLVQKVLRKSRRFLKNLEVSVKSKFVLRS